MGKDRTIPRNFAVGASVVYLLASSFLFTSVYGVMTAGVSTSQMFHFSKSTSTIILLRLDKKSIESRVIAGKNYFVKELNQAALKHY